MAAAVGVSLKRGFPATALGRVGLQVSPGAVVQWGTVPVTEAARSGEAAGRRREPWAGPRERAAHLRPAPEHPVRSPSGASLKPEGRGRAEGGKGRRKDGGQGGHLKVIWPAPGCWPPTSNPEIRTCSALCVTGAWGGTREARSRGQGKLVWVGKAGEPRSRPSGDRRGGRNDLERFGARPVEACRRDPVP